MPRKWIPPNLDDLLNAYRTGDSINLLSRRYGKARHVIQRIVIEAGLSLRSRSEINRIVAARKTPKERLAQVAAAHAAHRGQRVSPETLINRARTIEHLGRSTPHEQAVRELLSDAGLDTIPQQAIGPYNCDLGAHPVAVEVWGGHWHLTSEKARRNTERIHNFGNSGWHFFAIVITQQRPLGPEAADDVVAFVKRARRDPTSRREYRVVWGTGELLSAGYSDDDQITFVPPFTRGRDALGRYTNIPK